MQAQYWGCAAAFLSLCFLFTLSLQHLSELEVRIYLFQNYHHELIFGKQQLMGRIVSQSYITLYLPCQQHHYLTGRIFFVINVSECPSCSSQEEYGKEKRHTTGELVDCRAHYSKLTSGIVCQRVAHIDPLTDTGTSWFQSW